MERADNLVHSSILGHANEVFRESAIRLSANVLATWHRNKVDVPCFGAFCFVAEKLIACVGGQTVQAGRVPLPDTRYLKSEISQVLAEGNLSAQAVLGGGYAARPRCTFTNDAIRALRFKVLMPVKRILLIERERTTHKSRGSSQAVPPPSWVILGCVSLTVLVIAFLPSTAAACAAFLAALRIVQHRLVAADEIADPLAITFSA